MEVCSARGGCVLLVDSKVFVALCRPVNSQDYTGHLSKIS